MREKNIALAVVIAVVGVTTAWLFWQRQPKVVPDRASEPPNILPPEAKRVLDMGERFVLLSLEPLPLEQTLDFDPLPPPPGESEPPQRDEFHKYPILGKTEIQDQKKRTELLSALYKGIEGAAGYAPCFYPRHGISATLGSDTVDLVICFECGHIKVYMKHGEDVVAVADSAEPAFKRAVVKARLSVVEGLP